MTAGEALDKVEALLRGRLAPSSIPYAVGALADVRAELSRGRHHPEYDIAWLDAQKESPSREPYTDEQLAQLRVDYSPRSRGVNSAEAVVIWTLLDMMERQRGWK